MSLVLLQVDVQLSFRLVFFWSMLSLLPLLCVVIEVLHAAQVETVDLPYEGPGVDAAGYTAYSLFLLLTAMTTMAVTLVCLRQRVVLTLFVAC